MLKLLAVALPALAFIAAGVINASGRTQGDFVRWRYPPGWGRLTGVLEMAAVVLIAVPVTRMSGTLCLTALFYPEASSCHSGANLAAFSGESTNIESLGIGPKILRWKI